MTRTNRFYLDSISAAAHLALHLMPRPQPDRCTSSHGSSHARSTSNQRARPTARFARRLLIEICPRLMTILAFADHLYRLLFAGSPLSPLRNQLQEQVDRLCLARRSAASSRNPALNELGTYLWNRALKLLPDYASDEIRCLGTRIRSHQQSRYTTH